MKNKRGQIFSGILVLITVAMCLLSIGIYLEQQRGVQSSLVSPLVVLEVRDNLTVFEMREKELILSSLDSVDVDFGSDEFLDEFRDEFVSGLKQDSKMKDFIFSDLVWKGDKLKRGSFNEDAFLGNVVYGSALSSIDSSKITFGRGKIGKALELRALNVSQVNFAVDFSFDFDREYLIRKVGRGYVVEAVKNA